MNTNKNDKGFTLVELLIVIVILGILATVTVFAVRGITTDAKANACDTETKTLQTAAQSYFASNPSAQTIPTASPATTEAGPTVEDTLVIAGLLTEVSDTHDVSAEGVPTGTGDCAP